MNEFFEERTSVPLERHLVQEFLEKYEEVKYVLSFYPIRYRSSCEKLALCVSNGSCFAENIENEMKSVRYTSKEAILWWTCYVVWAYSTNFQIN